MITYGGRNLRDSDDPIHRWAAEQIERLREKSNGYENQLCRIAEFIGSDATEAPESDRTIAGLAIAEIERLKEAIRVRGGCRLLSEGEACDCGLCKRDNEIERLTTENGRLRMELASGDKDIGIT